MLCSYAGKLVLTLPNIRPLSPASRPSDAYVAANLTAYSEASPIRRARDGIVAPPPITAT